MSLEKFNDPATWHWAWPDRPDLHEFLCVGFTENIDHWIAYRRRDLSGARTAELHFGPIEVPGYLRADGTLLDLLEHGLVNILRNPDPVGADGMYLRHYGSIPDDMAVVPGPSFYFPGEGDIGDRDHEGSMLLPATVAMTAYADLLADSERLQDLADVRGGRVEVHGVEPWTDDHGRARMRWIATIG